MAYNDSLRFLLSKQLIDYDIVDSNNYLKLTLVGEALIKELNQTCYTRLLIEKIKEVDKVLHNVLCSDMLTYINNEI